MERLQGSDADTAPDQEPPPAPPSRLDNFCGLPPWHVMRMCCTDMNMRILPLRPMETRLFAEKGKHASLGEVAKGFLAWHRSVLVFIVPMLMLSAAMSIYELWINFRDKEGWFSNYFGTRSWQHLRPAEKELNGLYDGALALGLVEATADVACVVCVSLALRSWATLRRSSRRAALGLFLLIGPPFLLQLCFPLALSVNVDDVQQALCEDIFQQSLGRLPSIGNTTGKAALEQINAQLQRNLGLELLQSQSFTTAVCEEASRQLYTDGTVNVTTLIASLEAGGYMGNVSVSCDVAITATKPPSRSNSKPGAVPQGGGASGGGGDASADGGAPPSGMLRARALQLLGGKLRDRLGDNLGDEDQGGGNQGGSGASSASEWVPGSEAALAAMLSDAVEAAERRLPSRFNLTANQTDDLYEAAHEAVMEARASNMTRSEALAFLRGSLQNETRPWVDEWMEAHHSMMQQALAERIQVQQEERYCLLLQGVSSSATAISSTSSVALLTELRMAQVSKVLTSILPTAASIAASIGRAALVTKHLFTHSRLPAWLAMLFIFAGLPPLLALLALISQAISDVGVVFTAIFYVVSLMVWAPLGALPSLLGALRRTLPAATHWSRRLSTSELLQPMEPLDMRAQMATAGHRYYCWLLMAVVVFVVTLVVQLTNPYRGNYMIDALESWWRSLDTAAVVTLINVCILTLGKMYLALLVYADFALVLITTVWWQDAEDDSTVQQWRADEYLEMFQLFSESSQMSGDALASRDYAARDYATSVAARTSIAARTSLAGRTSVAAREYVHAHGAIEVQDV